MSKIKHITENNKDQWNTLAMSDPSFTLMQSWEWGEIKETHGWKTFRVAVVEGEKIVAGAQLLIKSLVPRFFSMAYVPRGPVGDWSDKAVTTMLLDELHRIARAHRAVFLRVEPPLLDNSPHRSILQESGFKPSQYTNQPRATIIVDLSHGMDSVMAQLQQKTRYNIRYAKKRGVTFRVGTAEDLPEFHRQMQITGKRGEFSVRSLDYYKSTWQAFSKKGQIRLFLAYYDGEPIAVNMSAIFGDNAAYLHGGSSGAYSKYQPNYLIMWEAFKWAHSQNCKKFDLWGIPDEVGISVFQRGEDLPINQRTDGLWGLYRFKRGFSRTVHLFTKAHDYAYLPFLYSLMLNKYINTNIIEKVVTFFEKNKQLA